MPYFDYRARNARGELLQGVLEGADSSAVASYLMNIGAIPVHITLSSRARAEGQQGWLERMSTPSVTPAEVQIFARQMHTLLKAGVPIMRCLKGLQESTPNKRMRAVLKDLRDALDAGRDLSTAMRAHPGVFSQYFYSMVQVGEMTGRLAEIFGRLHDYLEFDITMSKQIKAALRYPKFVITAMIGALGVVNVLVIPQFAKTFTKAGVTLPTMTRVLLEVSQFTVHWWPLMLGSAVAAFIGVQTLRRRADFAYRWDKLALRIPIAGSIALKGTMARFARSYALSYRSGLPIGAALTTVARTMENSYVATAVEAMRDGVERGESLLRTATTSHVFTPVVLQMISVGEETGEIDALMDEVATMYEQEVQWELKTLAGRMEPLLLGMMGVLVLILALGIFVPMWDMSQSSMPR